MRPLLRPIWAAVLAGLLVLTGQALAVARAAPGPAGVVELCTGTGPVMVYVDGDGQPIAPPHYCPDASQALLHALALPVPVAGFAADLSELMRDRTMARGASRAVPMAMARGPPLARPGLLRRA